jgi:hypothetical protein
MKLQLRILMLVALLAPLSAPSVLFADAFLMPGVVEKGELVKDFPQPYVVKKGDTLWDIAEEYFANPEKWLKIWEQNLQVTNPDLIYPGNEVWLRIKEKPKKIEPKREVVKLEPRVIYKPAEHIEEEVDTSILLTALARQDFIRPDAIEGVGHILDSEDERLNYGANDHVYLTLDDAAKPGDIYNIFRTGDPVYNPSKSTKEPAGYLVNHLGRVEVTSIESGVYRGTILNAFEEISRTDRLIKAEPQDFKIQPDYPKGPLFGHVMYIRNDAAEAGQGQVLGIDLGTEDGLRSGSVLGLYRMGRLIEDKVYEEKTYQALPEEKIGEMIVLAPQKNASIVLVTRSSSPINKGDIVQALRKR